MVFDWVEAFADVAVAVDFDEVVAAATAVAVVVVLGVTLGAAVDAVDGVGAAVVAEVATVAAGAFVCASAGVVVAVVASVLVPGALVVSAVVPELFVELDLACVADMQPASASAPTTALAPVIRRARRAGCGRRRRPLWDRVDRGRATVTGLKSARRANRRVAGWTTR